MKSNFINRLAEEIKGKYDLRKEEITVVFPNKRAAFYLRTQFTKIFQEDIWLPQMLSIQEAMTQWSGIQLVDNIDLMFELISINSELYHGKDSVRVFGNMAPQMASDFDEIDQYGADAGHIFSYLVEEKTLDIWQPGQENTEKEQAYLRFFKTLQSYYDKLRERLVTQGKGYYGMITRYLAGLSDEELAERTGHRKIIFAGFNAITPTEKTIIDKLYRNGLAEVVWDFDNYYVDDKKNEAGLFARRYQNVAWKPTRGTSDLLEGEKEIHLVSVMGNTIQAKALQSLLEVESDRNLAVILADESLLIPVLNSIPDDSSRFPSVNVSMGYPLRQTALYDLVNAYFTLHRKGRKIKEQGWYLWPILRILNLELMGIVFDKDEIAAINNYKKNIAKNSGFIYTADDFKRFCQSEDVITFMDFVTGEPKDMRVPKQFLVGLADLLSFLAQKIQKKEKDGGALFLLNQISEVGKAVNRLNDILTHYQSYVDDLSDLEQLFRLVSYNSTIKLNSSATSGLQVMGLLEARNLDFDTIYMVGVNEGILPTGKTQNSFIPYQIRKENGLPDYQEKQAIYAYHFYRQLQGAKRVFLLYNASSAESGGEPSRFLLQLKHELRIRNPKIRYAEEVFLNKTVKAPSPLGLSAHKTDAVMAKLMRKLQPGDADSLKRALAPTSLSSYIQCPFRFFMRYIMEVKDNSLDEEVQSNVIGTIVHKTLEKLYRNHRSTVISKDMLTQVIRPSLNSTLQSVIDQELSQGLSNVGFNYLNKLNIDKLLERFFLFEEQETNEHDLSVIDLEKFLSATLVVNGIPCTIAGTLDRIDSYNGTIRIIDYKTNHVSPEELKVKDKIEQIEDIPEKAMQLLIYKYLYLSSHPETNPDRVIPSIFGLKYQQVKFDLEVKNQALNEHFMDTMEGYLRELLSEMTDPSIPFLQNADPKRNKCRFCDFSVICVNTAAGSVPEDGR